ncbi:MAG: choice-of-anchor tandem repeat NxxGxxAF-containing protein [Planctomycetota bacterium]
MRTILLSSCVAGITAITHAGVPTYSTFELQCRSNFGSTFNLPPSTFFTNATPAINDSRQVAVQLSVVDASDVSGVWFGQNGAGSIVYTSPVGAAVSNPTMSNGGYTVFEQFFTATDGLFFYNFNVHTTGFITDQPIGASSWSSPTVNNNGFIGYRAGFFGDNAYYIWTGLSAVLVAAEVDLVASSPYSFIFTPTFNDADQIAAKVRLGNSGQFGESQPDEIRLFNIDGTSTLIETDIDGDAMSPFDSFDNSVAATTDGRVAFVANLPGNRRAVYLSDGTTRTLIASTASPDLNEIEFFSPTANDNGLVAFRGVDGNGLQAIFVGDGTTLTRVIGEHDLIPTDLGTGRIDQNDNSPVFGGSIRINESGDIAFNCALTPENNDQIEWGSGIYVAQAVTAIPCPWDCAPNAGNGVVNIDDLLAVINSFGDPGGPCDSAPDNGDGTFGNGMINIDDLLAVINNFGDCP